MWDTWFVIQGLASKLCPYDIATSALTAELAFHSHFCVFSFKSGLPVAQVGLVAENGLELLMLLTLPPSLPLGLLVCVTTPSSSPAT